MSIGQKRVVIENFVKKRMTFFFFFFFFLILACTLGSQ